MITERNRLHLLQKSRRMFKAKIAQVRDRGPVAVTLEIAAKLMSRSGLRAAPSQAADAFDAEYGTDTRGIVQPWNLDIPDNLVGQANQYGTAGAGTFTELLASLDIEHEHYLFADIGSGKGRALLLASRFPFKQIIGVELSSRLHKVSALNILRFRAEWQQCVKIVSLCQNAAAFSFPAENTVLYLFNPFGAETLHAVLTNLELSLLEVPRRVYVIYVKPVHKGIFEHSGIFSVLRVASEGSVIYVNSLPEIDRASG